MKWWHLVMFFALADSFHRNALSEVVSLPAEQWVEPFNNEENLRILCTDNNHFDIMRGRESPLINNLVRHHILCLKRSESQLQTRRYDGLIWLMQALGFCEIKRYSIDYARQGVGIEFSRDFQVELLRAAFALVCQKTDDIGRFHLSPYAEIFRLIYERENEHRQVVCNKAIMSFKELYERCHVGHGIEGSSYHLDYIRTRCITQEKKPAIRPRSFFLRFSRPCQSYPEFFEQKQNNFASLSFGQALANDTLFMNVLSNNIKHAIMKFSKLPQVVLKTRLLLQYFPMASIKLANKLQKASKCKLGETGTYAFDETTGVELGTNASTTIPTYTSVSNEAESLSCTQTDIKIYEDMDTNRYNSYLLLGRMSWLGLNIEFALIILSILLIQTHKKLSTAANLFVFNILFSNALFVASFICLFFDLFSDLPFNEDYTEDVPLDIAEAIQTHLFQPNEFRKRLVQETLFSLAQNGSLLGLMHLLILVLVVINRSMSGEAIRLSRQYVVAVFATVWIFLMVTHVIFSVLQYIAITNLDLFFARCDAKLSKVHLKCVPDNKYESEYTVLGEICSKISVFHTFGVYLLRGHTLFTLFFLFASIFVFLVTMFYHWRVRLQHDNLLGLRDQPPHRRRETMFNTLLFSIGAFFISVSGQSYIEIAVFWAEDRAGIANLATYYQWMRIASFVDPFFNPILISLRTPAIRRRLRVYFVIFVGMLSALFCPCLVSLRKRKASRTRNTYTSYDGSRSKPNNASPASKADKESDIPFKLFCAQQFVSNSWLRLSRRSQNSTRNHSVV
ncbi:G-PROTEIN-RECEP-F1-2 domain-containing protein [Aphelenchoides bicaudatus]|nr:G-PROTEIN-RECEP-F1-2 domain-containing protein [Aphelenchoides bicaudatus]